MFRCAALLNSDLSITNADVSLTGFDIPVGEYVKQIKFSGQLARICALFTNGSVKCVDFSSSFQVTTTYAMVNNGVVEKIQSGYSDFVVAILESGAIEIMSASSVIPVTGLTSTPIVNVAFSISNYFYVVTNDGRAYTCSLSITTGACLTVVREIEPANNDYYGGAYPDLLGNAVDIFTDLHAYVDYNFGAALLNDGTIRAWGRTEYGAGGDGNGNVCAIGKPADCTANPIQNVKQASGWADGMYILFADGTMTRYGRGDGQGSTKAVDLATEEDGVTTLDGILQIATEHAGKCCAINAAGSLFCAQSSGASADTFYLLEETPPPSPPSPSPPPPPNTITINGKQLYQDDDGWILLVAYNHVATENNALVPATAPQSPTAGYSHIWLADLGLTADDVDSVRFYCTSSRHNRVAHWSTSQAIAKQSVVYGVLGIFEGYDKWRTGTTKLDGHNASLPDSISDGWGAGTTTILTSCLSQSRGGCTDLLTVPFYYYGGDHKHWAIGGPVVPWSCDSSGSDQPYDTLHQIWFKKTSA